MAKKVDKELEQYRNLLSIPDHYEEGFGWVTIAGIIFCGAIMLPGAIYLSLMTGGGMGSAATWVTLILFSEITRRALKTMSKGNLVILLYVAGIMAVGGPFGELVMRAYYVTSDAARDMGIRDYFPTWWVPKPDSPAITERNLFHPDWLVPTAILLFGYLFSLVSKYTLGYFFFRLCSDVEQLPFPLAPISAQGTLALADSTKKPEELEAEEKALMEIEGRKPLSKWRVFSLGSVIGMAFGVLQVGVPAVTGLFLDKPVFIIPQPYLDTTTMTESIFPATPTGMVIDPGIIISGMVLPFWAIIGSFSAIVITMIVNPILHFSDILVQWQPGMNTVNTQYVNSLDFWMSFGFGTSAAIAAISIFSTTRDVIRRTRELRKNGKAAAEAVSDPRTIQLGSLWKTPNLGRGDYPLWIALIIYFVFAGSMIVMTNCLLPGVLGFMLFFVLVYNPFISYINARLQGLTGQGVDIPYVREGCFILSGCNKIDIWFAPIPMQNLGYVATSMRVNELTGIKFTSLMKADLVAQPTLWILSLLFWAFIWKSGPIPSDIYPAAQLNWELAAKTQAVFWSSTFHPEAAAKEDAARAKLKELKAAAKAGDEAAKAEIPKVKASMKISSAEAAERFADTEFSKALHPKVIALGAGTCTTLFILFSLLGLPTLFVYGLVRGFGALPHTMAIEIFGALAGRYYFQKKFGKTNFLRSAPALLAGYYTGVGLIGMCTIAMNLIKYAVSSAPF